MTGLPVGMSFESCFSAFSCIKYLASLCHSYFLFVISVLSRVSCNYYPLLLTYVYHVERYTEYHPFQT
jgi:hypothetical protein